MQTIRISPVAIRCVACNTGADMSSHIDQAWFVDRLAARKLSQRGLAKLMGLDPAAVSLMFRGKRKITLEEAAQLAVLLDVSTTEVLERSGLPVYGEPKVPLIGVLNSAYEIALAGEGAHQMVDAPPNVPSDCVAVQARTAGSEQDQIDGYLYFIEHAKQNPRAAVGDLSMVAIKGNGIKLAHVKRGYTRGTYNLITSHGSLLTNAELAWASPVIWIKTRT